MTTTKKRQPLPRFNGEKVPVIDKPKSPKLTPLRRLKLPRLPK